MQLYLFLIGFLLILGGSKLLFTHENHIISKRDNSLVIAFWLLQYTTSDVTNVQFEKNNGWLIFVLTSYKGPVGRASGATK